jgi:CubicO group peptidase (beta-lactamase class C family)
VLDEALQDVFARWAVRGRVPAIAWGLVRDGRLALSGGLGSLVVGADATPDADSVFRIASMTKSFTGAALMGLVADGALRLDDPVATHVPELAGWRGPTTDGPPLTIRHLASMEAGLPTDDPWADRHLDLPPEGLDAVIAAGAVFAHPPGIAFEYSNLSWGLLGRVIERVTGDTVQVLITRRLLAPLGMTATTWERPTDGAVAEPYRWEDDGWRHEGEPLRDGTIAPMGGLWTTVRDLAAWIACFLDAWPPRDDPDGGPIPRWARREMQQARRIEGAEAFRPRPEGSSRTAAFGYGIGLGVTHDPRLGLVVGHSGGLPGYGSHMRWLPERGLGIVALGNVTYARMTSACQDALEVLADRDLLPPARTTPAPRLEAAASRAASLLSDWSDEAAAGLLADNVVLDEAFDRRASAARAIARRADADLTVESLDAETPLRGAFVTGGGTVRVEVGLNHAGEVQWLDPEDRLAPSDAPILDALAALRAAAGVAYVVLRPVGDLAAAFVRWQGETIDRLGGARLAAPAAHVTMKAFGAPASPVTPDDERRIHDVVAAWAAASGSIDLRAEGLEIFDDEDAWVPVVRLAPVAALPGVWAAAAEAGLPAGHADAIGADGWIPHCSLAYVEEPAPAGRDAVAAWMGHVDVGGAACTVRVADLVIFDGGPERRLGRFVLGD